MADDVANSLENMKLTADEEETIEISDEGRRAEIESCTLSLIGKFLTCKSFNKKAAKNTLRRAWGLDDKVQMVEVGSNLFQFKFNSEFDLERIFNGGPWSFDNQMLLLTKWRQGMTAHNVRLNSASLWVQIWGAPFDMVSPKVAVEVGGRLGEVVEVEKRRKQDDPSYFMRVKVALPITKPLRRGGYLAGTDGARHWVTFKYERLPLLCHYCGVLGHDMRHCASYFAASKQGEVVELQYGDWLKATGGRSRSPVKRRTEQDHSPSPEEGKDREEVSGGRSAGKSKVTAAEIITTECPRETERHNKGDGVKSGEVTDVQLQNPTVMAIRRTDMERVENNETEGGNGNGKLKAAMKPDMESTKGKATDRERTDAKLNMEIIEDPTHTGHVDVTMQDGPAERKRKGTWTRSCRKDDGPGVKGSGEQHSILGKRVLTETMGSDYDIESEAQSGKRGRAESHGKGNEEISAGVVDHPCRAQ